MGAAAFALCAVLPASAFAAFPGENGKIAFQSTRAIAGICDPCAPKVYTMDPDGTGVARLDPDTSDLQTEREPDWSPDGTRLAYSRGPTPTINTIEADGSARTPVVSGSDPTWSPDATRIAFMRGGAVRAVNADGTGDTELAPAPFCETFPEDGASCTSYSDPAWSPDGGAVAWDGWSRVFDEFRQTWQDTAFFVTGTGSVGINDAQEPDWAPHAGTLAFMTLEPEIYSGNLATAGRDGTSRSVVRATGCPNSGPAWSPDGTKIAFEFGACGHGEDSEIYVMDADGSNVVQLTDNTYDDRHPSWQPIPVNGYPRPKAAPTVLASLVTAYEQCTAPDRTHGPPLAFGSCHPPAKSSQHLTVGTGDSNGLPPLNDGYVRLRAIVGNPSTPADEGDVAINFFSDDVLTSALADYAGELRATILLRITDKSNTPHPGGPGAATTQDFNLDVDVPCTPVADPQVGSACEGATTVDALLPGAITEGRRSIWQLGQVVVYDGGPDGDTETEPNTVFARQGVFIP